MNTMTFLQKKSLSASGGRENNAPHKVESFFLLYALIFDFYI